MHQPYRWTVLVVAVVGRLAIAFRQRSLGDHAVIVSEAADVELWHRERELIA